MAYPVPTVRAIIRDAAGRVLLLKRPDGDMDGGGGCLPGGKVDEGQTVEEAVAREIREETGLHCSSSRFLFYQDSPARQTESVHAINFYFACQAPGDVVLTDESVDFAWVAPSDLPGYRIVFRNDEGLARYFADSVG